MASKNEQKPEEKTIHVEESLTQSYVEQVVSINHSYLNEIKVGDTVTRLLCGCIPMQLKVSKITEDKIICGFWEFSKKTGCEIDDYLEWDGETRTGSWLQSPTTM